MTHHTVLAVSGLSLQRGLRRFVADLAFVVEPADRLIVRGASGSGKSTLLHALLGFVPVASGSVAWFGKPCRQETDFRPHRGPVGLLFQDPDDQLIGPTVLEDTMFGPLNLGLGQAAARQRATAMLQQLGIEALADRPVFALSGGEQRLAALAGVLAMQPRALLLDEPTTGLDDAAAQRVMAALLATGLPMVVATHDPACAATLGNRPPLTLGA